MTTTTSRSMRVIGRVGPALVVGITQGKRYASYTVVCGQGDESCRWAEWIKQGTGEVHHVERTAEGVVGCDCKGFTRWNHCRHQAATVVLAQRGLI